MSKKGFILLHRDIQNHWIYEEKRKFSRYEAWLDLLMMVNHKDNEIIIDGEIIEIKRSERITSIRQLMDKWDWSNTKVVNFLKLLEKEGMISFTITPKKKTLIKILQYDKYQVFQARGQSQKQTDERHETDSEETLKNINNNDKNEKNDNKKESNRNCAAHIYDESEIYYHLANMLYQKMLNNNSNCKRPNFQKWAAGVRLMIEQDKRTVEQITYLIDWCQTDNFWKMNILSINKLREKFDQLMIQANNGKFISKGLKDREEKTNEKHEKSVGGYSLGRLYK